MVVVCPPPCVTHGITNPTWPPTVICACAAGAAARSMKNPIVTMLAKRRTMLLSISISYLSLFELCVEKGGPRWGAAKWGVAAKERSVKQLPVDSIEGELQPTAAYSNGTVVCNEARIGRRCIAVFIRSVQMAACC